MPVVKTVGGWNQFSTTCNPSHPALHHCHIYFVLQRKCHITERISIWGHLYWQKCRIYLDLDSVSCQTAHVESFSCQRNTFFFFLHLYSNMSGWGLALGSHIQQSLQQKLSVHQSVEGGVLLFTGRQVLFSVRWTTSVNVLWLYLSITAISFSACLFQPASLPISEVYEHIHFCFHAFEASVSLRDLSVLCTVKCKS